MTSATSNADNLRFALFLALMCATYKAVLCFMRRVMKDDRLNAPVAGFFAGLFVMLDVLTNPNLSEVRQEYLNLAHQDPERFLIVDASLSIEQIHQVISERVLTIKALKRNQKQK